MVSRECQAELKRLIYGFRVSQCVYAAAVLGIADHLADDSRTASELAAMTETDPETLERLLSALTDFGILSRTGDGRFKVTPLSEPLREDAEGSLRAEILHVLDPSSWKPWGNLIDSVRSGEAAFPAVFGQSAWEYRADHPDVGALFDEMATAISKREGDAILEHLVLPKNGMVVDLGGGEGELLARLLAHRPNLRGLLLERPHVVANAEKVLGRAGVAERCQIVEGDFFKDVPAGGDLYLLKGIIHNWDDKKALCILQNCFRAMPSHARIVIIDGVADVPGTHREDLQDLHMLVIHGGRERTAAAYQGLLEHAGFRFEGIQDTDDGPCLIKGVPT